MSDVALIYLQVGLPQTLGLPDASDPMDRPWTTGFFKKAVSGRIWLGETNLDGDGQADLKYHGGPDKAVNVYPGEHYSYWRQLLGIDELSYGSFGENFTIEGLLEAEVCIGDQFEIGDAVVQVSQPRQPCWKLGRRWRIKDLPVQLQDTGKTGWYLRVLREGKVGAGDRLTLTEKGDAAWSVARANEVMHQRKGDREAARELAACAGISRSWRETLQRRAETGEVEDSSARLKGRDSDARHD